MLHGGRGVHVSFSLLRLLAHAAPCRRPLPRSYYIGEKYTLRYTGGMVPDVFQIIVKEKVGGRRVQGASSRRRWGWRRVQALRRGRCWVDGWAACAAVRRPPTSTHASRGPQLSSARPRPPRPSQGVFTNVISPSTKAKLRLLFEVAPLALLVEKAGGASSCDGLCVSGLDVEVKQHDQRTQVGAACAGWEGWAGARGGLQARQHDQRTQVGAGLHEGSSAACPAPAGGPPRSHPASLARPRWPPPPPPTSLHPPPHPRTVPHQICYGSVGEVRRFEEYMYGNSPRFSEVTA